MSLSIPNKFAANEYTSAAKMNANFDAVEDEVNTLGDSVTSAVASVATLTTTVAKHGSYAFTAQSSGDTTVTASAVTTVALATEVLDAGAAFATNTFTPGASGTGTYLFCGSVYVSGLPDSGSANLYISKGATNYLLGKVTYSTATTGSIAGSIILTAGATDTFNLKVGGTNIAGNFTVSDATFCGVRLLP